MAKTFAPKGDPFRIQMKTFRGTKGWDYLVLTEVDGRQIPRVCGSAGQATGERMRKQP
jgi:hypothetical protein